MSTEDNGNLEALQSIQRSINLLLKLKAHQLKGDRSQSEMILLLDSLGFKSGEIIELLGAPDKSVRPTLSRARKERKKKEIRRRAGSPMSRNKLPQSHLASRNPRNRSRLER